MRIDTPYYTARFYISYFMLLYSVSIILAKVVMTSLVAAKSLASSDTIIQSLGIVIDPTKIVFYDIFKTFSVDIVFVMMTPLLILNSSKIKRLEKENIEKYNEFLITSMNLQEYYYITISIGVIFSMVSTLFVPSAMCSLLLILNLCIFQSFISPLLASAG